VVNANEERADDTTFCAELTSIFSALASIEELMNICGLGRSGGPFRLAHRGDSPTP
jgi:hypothetical protein